MTLLIDSGNTRLKLVRVNPETAELTDVTALPYAAPDFEARLIQLLANFSQPKRCFLASVAANAWSGKILQHLASHGFDIHRVQSEKQAMGIRVAYLQPSRLGVDRFLGMIAGHHYYKKTLLIASVGTALTLDLIDNVGQHHGGVIAASESFVYQAMSGQFSVLKDLDGRPSGFSNTTDNALATGLRWMQLGAIEKALQEAKALGMNDVSLVLCGGGAEILRSDLPEQTLYRPHLVLEGLALWAQAHA
jgi:type III pantothenate kinase